MSANSTAVAFIAAAGLLLQSLDSTIISTALPRLAEAFGEPAVNMGVAITAYVAALAVFMPASGWLADRFGSRAVFQGAIGVFTLGSLLCALSGSLTELTAARILQGAGGSMLTPIGRLVVLRNAPRDRLIHAMATFSLLQQIGPLLGPPIGGFIVAYSAWQWIFLINLPLGIIAIVVAPWCFDNDPSPDVRPFDKLGFVLVGGAFACLIASLNMFEQGFAAFSRGAFLVVLGVGLAFGAVHHLRRSPHPLVDLGLLRIPTFRINVTGGAAFRIGVGALSFLLPLLLQIPLGFDAFTAGLIIFAGAVGQIGMKPTMPRLLRRYGFRTLLLAAGAAFPLALVLCGSFRLGTPIAFIVTVAAFAGFFQSLQFSALNMVTFADVPHERMSHATGLAQVLQQFAIGIGVAISSILLQASLAIRQASDLTFADFTLVLWLLAVVAVVAIGFYLRLSADAGRELIMAMHRRRARE